MPARSRVRQLPADIRSELNAKLIDGGFADYSGLADWLAERGFSVSRSAVHRYGAELERRIEQIRLSQEHAAALVEATGDEDAGVLADASMSLVQRQMFEVMLASEGNDLGELAKAARALADTGRAGVTVRADRRKALAAAAEKAGAVARSAGLSPEVVQAIRDAVEQA